MTALDQTRYNVENSFAGLGIISPGLKESVQIEGLATHLNEQPEYPARQFVHSLARFNLVSGIWIGPLCEPARVRPILPGDRPGFVSRPPQRWRHSDRESHGRSEEG